MRITRHLWYMRYPFFQIIFCFICIKLLHFYKKLSVSLTLTQPSEQNLSLIKVFSIIRYYLTFIYIVLMLTHGTWNIAWVISSYCAPVQKTGKTRPGLFLVSDWLPGAAHVLINSGKPLNISIKIHNWYIFIFGF